MRLFTLTFFLGVLCLQYCAALPPWHWIFLGAALSIVICSAVQKYRIYLFILAAGFWLGLSWANFYSQQQMAWTLPHALEGKNLIVTGHIVSIPIYDGTRAHFLLAINYLSSEQQKISLPTKISLSWQTAPDNLQAGDFWQLPVRLKRIHSLQNPGGFDYAALRLQQGVRAQGYVVERGQYPKLLAHDAFYYPILSLRQRIFQQIHTHLAPTSTSPWIAALAIGERQGIPVSAWRVLRNTGTNHLMAIAGLHIGFMSLLAYRLCAFIWRLIPSFMLKIPVPIAGKTAALLMALLYSALAGFSLPTQRASLMLCLFILLSILRRHVPAWHVFSVALICTLTFNPLSVLSDSFYLSFGAVALIIYGMSGRLAPSGLWWQHGRIQWVIALGLIPLSIGLFQQCSIIGFLANCIAIPLVAMVIVPLTLGSCFLLWVAPSIASLGLLAADKILQCVWWILTFLADLPFATWYHAVPYPWVLFVASIGILLLLLPSSYPGRWLGFIWLLPLFFLQPRTPLLGEAWVTLLDVGQGLSAVIQTQKHTMVYDAGAKLSDNYDMGESVVLPFLYHQGMKKLDLLMISHGDNDHSGGAGAILAAMPHTLLLTSVPERFTQAKAYLCLPRHWQWDQIDFAILAPSVDHLRLGNNSSCVLRVSNAAHQVLFTGDIERPTETILLNNYKNNELKSDVLIIPHHGSKTSSTLKFIQAVQPKIGLISAGYRNRYRLPNQRIVERYQQLGVKTYNTVQTGAIQVRLSQTRVLPEPLLYHAQHRRYWQEEG